MQPASFPSGAARPQALTTLLEGASAAAVDSARGSAPQKAALVALLSQGVNEATRAHSGLPRGESFRSEQPVDHLRDVLLQAEALGTGTPEQDAVTVKSLIDNLPRDVSRASKLTYAFSRHFTAPELSAIEAALLAYADARGVDAELARMGITDAQPVGPTRLDQDIAAGYAHPQAGTRWRG